MREALTVAALLLLSGCLSSGEDLANSGSTVAAQSVAATKSALLNGTPTDVDPEVGIMWGPSGPCTATLIGPRAIITAAHCFNYQSNPSAIATGWPFFFKSFALERNINGYISLTNEDDAANDIAVAALDQAVDPTSDGVFWLDVGLNFPTNDNEQLLLLGYGCGDPQTNGQGIPTCTASSDFSVKRGLNVAWWGMKNDHELTTAETQQLTITDSGDSGGPMIRGGSEVLFVVSGTVFNLDGPGGVAVSGRDQFGNVAANFNRVNSALATLGVL
jgi:hypothetical protein